MTTSDLRFPIGPFRFDGVTTPARRHERIERIAAAPQALRAAVRDLTDAQLDTPYRPGGWTVRQVVHHLPDSHANAYIRFKLALTEDVPTIRPYDEARWAELRDGRTGAVEISLRLLEAIHDRWLLVLRALGPGDLERTLFHPERNVTMTLDELLELYAWHGSHHIAHITGLREREGWTSRG